MSSFTSHTPMPCHLDADLLTLAVHLARRDVARLRAPADLTIQQQRLLSLLSENSDPALPSVSDPVVSESNVPPPVAPLRKRPTAPDQSIQPSTRARGSGCSYRPVRSHNADGTHLGSVDDLPPCSVSPPTRDTDPWVPSRTKPLHEPTEKQLQSARESHMRQLQAKIARYSAAMSELRLQQRSKTAKEGSEESEERLTFHARGCGRGRGRGRSTSGRVQSSGKSGPCSSLLRQEVVPLCPRSRTAKSAQLQRFPEPSSFESEFKACTERTNPDVVAQRMDQQVNDLWQHTIRALRERNPELIVLEPEDEADTISDLHPMQPDNRVVQLASPFPPPESDCSCSHSVHAASSTDLSSSRFDTSGLLQELDQAEAEEAEIRQRWAHLSRKQLELAAASHVNVPDSDRQTRTSALQATSSTQPNSNPARAFQEVGSTGPGCRFRPGHEQEATLPTVCLNRITHETSQTSGSSGKNSSSVSDRVPLRLPTNLHRAILTHASETQQLKEKRYHERGMLTAPSARNIRVAHVCEWLSEELVDQVIGDVADDLEREMGSLIDAVVDGELRSEAAESSSVTGNASVHTPAAMNSDSGTENSTRASGSLDSDDKSLTSSPNSAFPPKDTVPSQSKQSRSHTPDRTDSESHSDCVTEPTYTFQFEQVSESADNASRSSTTLLANLLLAQSEKILDSDESEDDVDPSPGDP